MRKEREKKVGRRVEVEKKKERNKMRKEDEERREK